MGHRKRNICSAPDVCAVAWLLAYGVAEHAPPRRPIQRQTRGSHIRRTDRGSGDKSEPEPVADQRACRRTGHGTWADALTSLHDREAGAQLATTFRSELIAAEAYP